MKKILLSVTASAIFIASLSAYADVPRSGTWVGTWRTASTSCTSFKNTNGQATLAQGEATNSPNPNYVTFESGTLTLVGFSNNSNTPFPDFGNGAKIDDKSSIGNAPYGDTHVITGSVNFQGGYQSYYETPTTRGILQIESPSYSDDKGNSCTIIIEKLLYQS